MQKYLIAHSFFTRALRANLMTDYDRAYNDSTKQLYLPKLLCINKKYLINFIIFLNLEKNIFLYLIKKFNIKIAIFLMKKILYKKYFIIIFITNYYIKI